MKLIVAEKPSVARDIARVLKCTKKGDGYLFSDEYVVSWAVGHLITLKEPQEIDEKYKRWSLDTLPIIPKNIEYKVISSTYSQFEVLKKLMLSEKIDSIVCATDAGREGELIFRLIYQMADSKKACERLWISSLTDQAIKDGFNKLKPQSDYDGLYYSALARQTADWLIGMNLSRVYTINYKALLSIGRVQTPTLAILVKRLNEINAFVPEEFYTLTADFGDFSGKWFDEKAEDDKLSYRILDKSKLESIQKLLKGESAELKEKTTEEKRELPPLLYDLTSLQREVNKSLGLTASKCLSVAQALYEKHKCITYPRTDSKHLSDDMYPKIKNILNSLPSKYLPMLNAIDGGTDNIIKIKRVFDNAKLTDHHAIIPTSQRFKIEALTKDEQNLYEMIVKRFIAAFCKSYIYDSVKLVMEAKGNFFKTYGRIVKQKGFTELIKASKEEGSDEKLPDIEKGDLRKIKSLKSKKENTKPPSHHTDASLLSAMENAGKELEDEELKELLKGSGLGTPATRAAVIDRIINVGYVKRQGKSLIASEKGEKLIKIVPDELASSELTGKWERSLNEISAGKESYDEFDARIRKFTVEMLDKALKGNKSIEFEREQLKRGKLNRSKVTFVEDAVCPICNGRVIENSKAFSCENWKTGCHFTFWKNCFVSVGGPLLNDKIIALLLKDKKLVGSTGTIELSNNKLSFTKKGENSPVKSVGIEYIKQ